MKREALGITLCGSIGGRGVSPAGDAGAGEVRGRRGACHGLLGVLRVCLGTCVVCGLPLAGEDSLSDSDLGGENLVENGSFELGDRGWFVGHPRALLEKPARKSREIRDFVRDAHRGKWALRLRPEFGILQVLPPGVKAADIDVVVWSKGKTSSASVSLYSADKKLVKRFPVAGSEGFEESAFSVRPPDSATEPLSLLIEGVRGALIVDDVHVAAAAAAGGDDTREAGAELGELAKKTADESRKRLQEQREEEWKRRNSRPELQKEPMARHLYCRLTVSKESAEPLSFELSATTTSFMATDLDGWPCIAKGVAGWDWGGYWMGALPAVQFGPPGLDANLRPGERSPWLDIIPPIIPDTTNTVRISGAVNGELAKAMDFTIELALEPKDEAVFYKRHCKKSGNRFVVLFPGRKPASVFAKDIRDEQHAADAARDAIAALGPPQYGKPPQLFQLGGRMSGRPAEMGWELFGFWVKVFKDLGMNTIGICPEGIELARQHGLRTYPEVSLPGDARAEWLLQCDWEQFEKDSVAAWQKALEDKDLDRARTLLKTFGNETNAPGMGMIIRDPHAQEWFRQYLQERGFKPEDFGAQEWAKVRPCTRYEYVTAIERNKTYDKESAEIRKIEETEKEDKEEKDDAAKTLEKEARETYEKLYGPLPYDNLACARLYYWSNRFRYHTMEWSYEKAASILFKTKPKELKLDVCAGWFSDGWMHEGGGNMFEEAVGSGSNLLNMTKAGGSLTSMGASNLIYWGPVYGWTQDVLRSSGKGGRFIAIHDGLVPSWRDPISLEYTMFMKIAHGAKTLDYYPYGPYPYEILDGPLTGKPDFFPQIRRINYMLGDAEELIVPGVIPRGQIAFIYNQTADLWALMKRPPGSGAEGAMGLYTKELNEKRGVWLALRHANYACDIFSDWDLPDGVLQHYRVAYLAGSTGPHIDSRAAEALRDWVKNGGILWVDCGTGRRDEYDRPFDLLDTVWGVRETEIVYDKRPKKQPLFWDEIVLGDASGSASSTDAAWVVDRKAKVEALRDAKVLARFKDGSPALIESRFGDGRVFYSASYPGLAYFRGVYPWISFKGIGKDYPQAERALVAAAAEAAALDRWVIPSKPVIQWGYLLSDKGLCVPLMNYRYEPEENLQVSVKVPKPVETVRSTIHGPLKFTEAGGRIQFALPLDRCDFVSIYFKPQ